MMFLLILSSMGWLFFIGDRMISLQKDVAIIGDIESHARLSKAANALIHSLQCERGLMVAFNDARTPPFAERLRSQSQDVDLHRRALQEAWRLHAPFVDVDQDAQNDAILMGEIATKLNQWVEKRGLVHQGAIVDNDEILHHYNETIALLEALFSRTLDRMGEGGTRLAAEEVLTLVNEMYAVRITEYLRNDAGLELARMVDLFIKQALSQADMDAIVAHAVTQEAARTFLNQMLHDIAQGTGQPFNPVPAVGGELAACRNAVAMQQLSMIEPLHCFDVASVRIDHIFADENHLIEHIGDTLASLHHEVVDMRDRAVWQAALFLLLLLIFSLTAVRSFLRPIRQVRRACDDIAHGLLERPVSVTGRGDERAMLLALESMREQLLEHQNARAEEKLRDDEYLEKLFSLTAELEQNNEKLNEALAKAELATLAKSRFLATMSHEIRTPMNGVLGMAEALSFTPLNAGQKQYVSVIMRAGKNLLTIINDILDYSKIEAGKLTLDPCPTQLRALVDELLEVLRFNIGDKDLQLFAKIADDLPYQVHVDPVRMRQVLFNLLGNAIKFTEQGFVILEMRSELVEEVGNAGEPLTVCILKCAVKDTGIGLNNVQQAALFQPFSQAEASTTRKFGGTGLGLSITKDLIEMMGGEIGVTSVVGEGSTFWFALPLPVCAISAPAESGEESGERAYSSSAALSGAVLLVEDDELNVMVVLALLGDEKGLIIDVARNGLEALESFRTRAYGVILMDCQMPELDGFAATRRIRALEALHDEGDRVPIIALTANAQASDAQACLDAGMDGFVSKPFSQSELLSALRHWMRCH
ncbi:MAG: response regulator [Zetaproteobacteria bacterium]|nr:response regulator [Zetaproteobacteria bacterium]